GRYERLFARLRDALRDHEEELAALLQLRDPAEQARRADPDTPLRRALDAAYDDVLALPHLVRLFGEGATQNPVEPFARHPAPPPPPWRRCPPPTTRTSGTCCAAASPTALRSRG